MGIAYAAYTRPTDASSWTMCGSSMWNCCCVCMSGRRTASSGIWGKREGILMWERTGYAVCMHTDGHGCLSSMHSHGRVQWVRACAGTGLISPPLRRLGMSCWGMLVHAVVWTCNIHECICEHRTCVHVCAQWLTRVLDMALGSACESMPCILMGVCIVCIWMWQTWWAG